MLAQKIRWEDQASLVRESGVMRYLRDAGIPARHKKKSFEDNTGKTMTTWEALQRYFEWTYSVNSDMDSTSAPQKFGRLDTFAGIRRIRNAVRGDMRLLDCMNGARIAVPADWLSVAENQDIQGEKDVMTDHKTKRSLGKYISDANEAWAIDYECDLLVAENETGTNEKCIHMREAFKDETMDNEACIRGLQAAIQDLLTQLRERFWGQPVMQRLLRRLMLPFYATPGCRLICNTDLADPSPFGAWGHGTADIATQLSISKTSLFASVTFLAEATRTDDWSRHSAKVPAPAASRMACCVQATLQQFIIHHIEENTIDVGAERTWKPEWDPWTEDVGPDLPDWMRVYGLSYSEWDIQVWVFYPCYRLYRDRLRWGYACSKLLDIRARNRLMLLRILLLLKTRSLELATRLCRMPLRKSKEMIILEDLWVRDSTEPKPGNGDAKRAEAD